MLYRQCVLNIASRLDVINRLGIAVTAVTSMGSR